MADDIIDSNCLPPEMGHAKPATGPYLEVRIGCKVAEVERRLIIATLEQCGGTKERAAEILGISLKTLYNRLREYNSQPAAPSGPVTHSATNPSH
jgi:two-component system response regulator AtoC